jgi:hypothetical protein
MEELREEPAAKAASSNPKPARPQAGEKSKFDLQEFIGSERVVRFLYYLCGGVFITLIFRKLQFSTQSICCGDFDGYYHIRWSRLLWENFRSGHILPPDFIWLPLTTLDQQNYVDHHYLFHLMQIPFTWFFSLPTAAKLSALLFASLAVFACYWLVMRHRLDYPLLWLLALVGCSAPFLYRMNMAKAPPLAIIFMVVGIQLLFTGKYKWLAPLMFAFVWTYSLFPTLLLAAIIWTGVIAWSEWRFEWRPMAFTAAGMLAGLVINPYFPRNIVLELAHVMMKVRPGQFNVDVGQEWYPYDSWVLLMNCAVAFVAMIVGYLAAARTDRVGGKRPVFFLFFSTVLMIGTFRWRRFVEYWPPFAILFAAFSLQALFDQAKDRVRAKEDFLRDLEPLLDKPQGGSHFKPELVLANMRLGASVIAGILLLLFIVLQVRGLHNRFVDASGLSDEIAETAQPNQYQKGMEWIWANVPKGQRIFNTDWDDFPKMFYYDQSHTYVSGLDPNYLFSRSKELSDLYRDITLGKVEDPGPIIRDKFGAQYVFTDKEDVHDEFYANAIASGWFDNVYEDDECAILKLRATKGPVPDEAKGSEAAGPEDQSGDEGDGEGSDSGDEGDGEKTMPVP